MRKQKEQNDAPNDVIMAVKIIKIAQTMTDALTLGLPIPYSAYDPEDDSRIGVIVYDDSDPDTGWPGKNGDVTAYPVVQYIMPDGKTPINYQHGSDIVVMYVPPDSGAYGGMPRVIVNLPDDHHWIECFPGEWCVENNESRPVWSNADPVRITNDGDTLRTFLSPS